MPFPRPQQLTPTAVGRIVIELADQPAAGETPSYRKFGFRLVRLAADGSKIDVIEGDLAPHLTAQQTTALNNFMDAMRTKAQEVLP